jgi:hypothetical protein
MKRVDTTQDRSRGTVTYRLDDGRYVTLDANAVGLYGAENLVRWLGLERIPVMQHGRRVGTLPVDAEHHHALRREGKAWVAEEQLDLNTVKEFARDVRW